jgi:hypothetical protein
MKLKAFVFIICLLIVIVINAQAIEKKLTSSKGEEQGRKYDQLVANQIQRTPSYRTFIFKIKTGNE